MPIAFNYLQNTGTATSWDITAYREYVARVEGRLSPDLRDMTSSARFDFDRSKSFWYSDLLSAQTHAGGSLELSFVSDNSERIFTFSYSGILRFESEFSSMRFMPQLIVQELVLLPLHAYQHVLSSFCDRKILVHAKSVRFSESQKH